jgi:hypothetical protein
MTMWLGVKFSASDVKPYPPINLKDDQDRLKLTITARLKIAAQGRKVPELKQRWEDLTRARILEVNGLGKGLPIPAGERWAMAEFQVTRKQEEVASEMIRIGTPLLRMVETFKPK